VWSTNFLVAVSKVEASTDLRFVSNDQSEAFRQDLSAPSYHVITLGPNHFLNLVPSLGVLAPALIHDEIHHGGLQAIYLQRPGRVTQFSREDQICSPYLARYELTSTPRHSSRYVKARIHPCQTEMSRERFLQGFDN
jgi:hypothetical protein